MKTHEALEALWASLDTDIDPVLNDDGAHVAGALIRRLPSLYGESCWLYVDEEDGYLVLGPEDGARARWGSK